MIFCVIRKLQLLTISIIFFFSFLPLGSEFVIRLRIRIQEGNWKRIHIPDFNNESINLKSLSLESKIILLIHSRNIRALFCKIPYHLLNLNRKELPELESGDLDAEEEEEDTDGEHSVLLPPEDINLLGKVIY